MATPAPLRVAHRDLVHYRRLWKAGLMASLVQPLLFLLGIGIGVGKLVDQGSDSAVLLDGVSYFAFYSAALLATTAMFTSSQQAMWPTMDGFMWSNAYRAMTATPIEPRDVAAGVQLYHAFRLTIGAVGVAVVLALFDDTRTWGLLLGVPASVLTGMAFSMPISAWTATRVLDQSFPAIMRFVITPMFLFGGAFFPIDQLPAGLRPVAWVTPLWHGVELCRGVVLGGLSLGRGLLHTAALGAFVLGGWVACTITFRQRLHG
ncbi:MAG: ABC transporter permease [Actinomycetia bacterium]|nr:ABC transporter permease [Actinomycetes bacterium]MCP4086330.1 ABC transporter permease [Actinomycetes bacterium]